MKQLWRLETRLADEVVVRGDRVVSYDDRGIFATDPAGELCWRVDVDGLPGDLTACDEGVAAALKDLNGPTTIIKLGLDGNEQWRYASDGNLIEGLTTTGDTLILATSDFPRGRVVSWTVLDAVTGAVRHRIDRPGPASDVVAAWPCDAGWLVRVEEGAAGLAVMDPRTGAQRPLSDVAHVAFAVDGDVAVIDTWGYEESPRVIAIDVATGRTRWQRPGGRNLYLGLAHDRVAWVVDGDDGARAVVHDRATGARLWTGAPLGPIGKQHQFTTVVNERAVVVYGNFAYTSVFGYDGDAPTSTRPWGKLHASRRGLVGDRLYEGGVGALTCWQVP